MVVLSCLAFSCLVLSWACCRVVLFLSLDIPLQKVDFFDITSFSVLDIPLQKVDLFRLAALRAASRYEVDDHITLA